MELRGQLFSCLFCTILLSVIPCSGQKYQGWTVLLKNGFTTGHVSLDLKNVHPAERLQNGAVHSPNEWSTEVATKLQIAEASEESPETSEENTETSEENTETPEENPGQKYQGRIALLKNGFTTGNVSLKLKNVRPADRLHNASVHSPNEWSTEVATELQTAEFKNGETLREKGKKRVRFPPPENSEENTEFKNGETLREKGKKRVRYSLPEAPEKSIGIMDMVILALLLSIIIIGIIFLIYYCYRNRSRDPEKERLTSAEEGRLQRENNELPIELKEFQGERRPGVDESQSQERLQRKNNELQAELRRLQKEKEELKGELNWRMIYKYADNITFDAGTAHPNLYIAWDQKSLKHEAQPQNVSPNPKRFDSTVCVLGLEGFSTGKHYWEVDVVSSNDWDLGVARESIQRKGKLSLSPKEGFWALGLSGRDYWAKTDPWTRVMVQRKPKKIGVYLRYQERQVTFFNVTDMSVLFTFNDCSFSGAVYPFFKNSNKETTMRICSVREDE